MGVVFRSILKDEMASYIKPADNSRRIEKVSYKGFSEAIPINTQISYKNLLASITVLCEAADIGLKTCFNPADGVFDVSLYRGCEVQGVFSREYENVLNTVSVTASSGGPRRRNLPQNTRPPLKTKPP